MFRDDERVCCVILIHLQQPFFSIPIDVRLPCFVLVFLVSLVVLHIHIYIDSIVHTSNIASKEEDRAFLFIHVQGGVGQLAKIYIGESAIAAVRLPGMYLIHARSTKAGEPGDYRIIESCPNAGRSHDSNVHLPA